MIFIPSDIMEKNRKLARPYHGPFRIVDLIRTNFEVQLIEHPQDQTIIVATDRLQWCYSDKNWYKLARLCQEGVVPLGDITVTT